MSRDEEIAENLGTVQERIRAAVQRVDRDPAELTLIVVTKNFPASDLEILYKLGIRDFGENRNEEAVLKVDRLPRDITWHFLGQIQSRKISSICGWTDVVHSLDSLEHARKFAANDAIKFIEFFVQVNLEPDRSDRGGVAVARLPHFFDTLVNEIGITPIGLMTVAPLDLDPSVAFDLIHAAKGQLIEAFSGLRYLSMGMSNDFEAAIMAGATHLRIGSSILGSRHQRA